MINRFLFSALVVASASAQPLDSLWSRTYGGSSWDECNAVRQTADGGFILAGVTEPFGVGVAQWYLVKTNSDGDTLWTRMYGGNSWDECYTVEETADGFILGGYTHQPGANGEDIWLVKTNLNGDLVWSQAFDRTLGDYCYSVRPTSDGGYIVGGNILPSGGNTTDIWLIKTDANGDSEWTRIYGGSRSDFCRSVLQTPDGGYLLCGYTRSYGPEAPSIASVWLVKIDEDGDSLWSRTFGGFEDQQGNALEPTADGGYIIAGLTYDFGIGTPFLPNALLIKVSENGDSLWGRVYGGVDEDIGMSVQETNNGGYILGGYTYSFGDGTPNAWIVETDSIGDSLWSRAFGGFYDDRCFSVRQIADGDFVMAGSTNSYGIGWGGGPNMWLLKLGRIEHANEPTLPEDPYLLGAYPNPFNSATAISFSVPITGRVKLTLYDVTGRMLEVLADETFNAGTHRLDWTCKGCTSGVYVVRMEAGSYQTAAKLMMLK